MSLQGDLSTLELGDLLQNLEIHQRTGVLQVEGIQGSVRMFFRNGRLSLFSSENRPELMDVLVASGTISERDFEAARKKRRRSRKSLGEVLIAGGALSQETLIGVASARLLDEACELIASELGAFSFSEGQIPRGVFDPEERRLGIEVPCGPLLMEAARREDHWHLIRQRIPSDSAHYLVQRKLPGTDPAAQSELAHSLLGLLDGTSSVGEVMASFPHRRFEAYQQLSDFFDRGIVRLAGPDDLIRLAQDVAHRDLDRSRVVIERGLSTHSRHEGLLAMQAELAEEVDDLDTAADALKILVHQHLEAGETDKARGELERAKELDPSDASLWERSFQLALEEARNEEALIDGRELASLYRAPGLHRKALGIFEQLVELYPDDWDLRRELSHSQVDCGALEHALKGLERFGTECLATESYERARLAFAEIIHFDPGHEGAKSTIESIDNGELERRRALRRKIFRRIIGSLVALVLLVAIFFEGTARLAYSEAIREVSEENLIEQGRYADVIALLEAVKGRHPYTVTALVEVPRHIRELERKAAATKNHGLDDEPDVENGVHLGVQDEVLDDNRDASTGTELEKTPSRAAIPPDERLEWNFPLPELDEE